MTNITLITDASWCPHTNVAGWASWGVCDDFRVKKSGPVLRLVPSSGAAELCAIANGIHTVLTNFPQAKGSTLIVQTDCQEALDVINRQITFSTAFHKEVVEFIRKKINLAHIKPVWRHVKGHADPRTADKRSFVNIWCDREAKIHMRAARDRYKERNLQPVAGD